MTFGPWLVEQKALAWSHMSEAHRCSEPMSPGRTLPMAKEVMSIPLKSVAKGKTQSRDALIADRTALPAPGVGFETQVCQVVRQVLHRAAVGRAAMPQALHRTGRR